MAEAAVRARELTGCELIDINMGCPTGKIVRNGEGCALMREPALAERIISAVVKAVDVPVTVKFRKGWDRGCVNAVDFAAMAEGAGASAAAVHGRTRTQFYSGAADWDIIRDVKSAVSIPVMANGDVFEPEDAGPYIEVYGRGPGAGRPGAMGNPWIFQRETPRLTARKYRPCRRSASASASL
jgi:nifR3 family TIM-barrel protein